MAKIIQKELPEGYSIKIHPSMNAGSIVLGQPDGVKFQYLTHQIEIPAKDDSAVFSSILKLPDELVMTQAINGNVDPFVGRILNILNSSETSIGKDVSFDQIIISTLMEYVANNLALPRLNTEIYGENAVSAIEFAQGRYNTLLSLFSLFPELQNIFLNIGFKEFKRECRNPKNTILQITVPVKGKIEEDTLVSLKSILPKIITLVKSVDLSIPASDAEKVLLREEKNYFVEKYEDETENLHSSRILSLAQSILPYELYKFLPYTVNKIVKTGDEYSLRCDVQEGIAMLDQGVRVAEHLEASQNSYILVELLTKIAVQINNYAKEKYSNAG